MLLRYMARTESACGGANPVPPLNGTRSLLKRLFSWVPSWKPTSEEHLKTAEESLLQKLSTPYKDTYVPISPSAVIRTFTSEQVHGDNERLPLVMIHGFGGGFLQFYKNLDHLSTGRKLLALDLPGFGRSTRTNFSKDPLKAEDEFVDSIENWRRQVGVEKFILLGHSLGAYLACSYTIRHPSRVRHLVLVDPWGFDTAPTEEEFRNKMPWTGELFWRFMATFKPFDAVRAAGPWGLDLVKRMRPDLERTFGTEFLEYVYHCNAQKPTGEAAYFSMQHYFGWAKHPMLSRLHTHMDPRVPITLIYGSESWMRHVDTARGEGVQKHRPHSYVGIHWVEGAGHHVHADQAQTFNELVSEVCSVVDAGEDTTDHVSQ